MIAQIIGWYCLVCFVLSQIVLLLNYSEDFKNKKVFVHIASALYAIAAGYLLK